MMSWINSFLFFSLLSLGKAAFDVLAFCSFSMINLRYIWGNYILSNFHLLFGLLRLVGLILAGQQVHSYFIMRSSTSRMQVYTFSYGKFSLTTVSILQDREQQSTSSSEHLIFSFFLRLFYLLTRFLPVLITESSPSHSRTGVTNLFPCFLCSFGCYECWFRCISRAMCHIHHTNNNLRKMFI